MSISSVSSGLSSQISNIQQNSSVQPVRAERENDGDKDDGSASKVSSPAPAPTTNTNGQVIGSTINVTA